MIPRRHRTTGFAMVTAIVLIGLAAMTMTALSITIYTQATRTRLATEDAQLRQLLIAGATFAIEKAQSNTTGHFQVSLPDPLRANAAKLTIDLQPRTSDNEQTAEVEASLPHHRTSQRLKLALQNGAWQIAEARFSE